MADPAVSQSKAEQREENWAHLPDAERQRRRRIGVANSGRVPWNKGKPRSAGEPIEGNTVYT